MSTKAGRLPVHSDGELGAKLARIKNRVAWQLQLGLRSRFTRYGLRRDLSLKLDNPSAKIPITVRPLVGSDVPELLPTDLQADRQEQLEISWRRGFLEKGAKECFVAVDQRDGTPCYMQWLMRPADNDFILGLRSFPALKPEEALLENAYTPVKYCGLGIMSAAMALIAERAVDFGARYVLTFVDQDNIASLKGCQRAGFSPHLLHNKDQLAFGLIKRNRFEELDDADPRLTLRF